jgi:hypothetical protein
LEQDNVGQIYGLMLTACSFASAFGPLLIAKMYVASGAYSGALRLISVVLLVSLILPILVRPHNRRQPLPLKHTPAA